MRTTLTFDPDVEAMVRTLMQQTGLSFEDAVNLGLRRALAGSARVEAPFPSYDLGLPKVDLTHALDLAAAMDDAEAGRQGTR